MSIMKNLPLLLTGIYRSGTTSTGRDFEMKTIAEIIKQGESETVEFSACE